MPQKTKRDWLEAGLHILGELGANGLTIDELTRRLGVTKGSFYHHFEHYQEYKEHLLAFFEEEGTLQIIQLMEQESTPARKLARLLEVTTRAAPDREVALRAWALLDTQVRGYQERIDQRRLAYLADLFSALTQDAAQGVLLARLFYALYVGSQHIVPPLQGEALKQLYQELQRLPGLFPLEQAQ